MMAKTKKIEEDSSSESKIKEDPLLLVKSIQEILNVAWGHHELTSEHIQDVILFWEKATL